MNIFTSKPLRRVFAAALLGAASAGFALAGTPGDSTDVRSATVSYRDLNLSSREAAAVLYRRIVQAARDVCDRQDIGLGSQAEARACSNKAIADAVTQVGHPQLIAVYNAKNHRSLPTRVASAR